MKLDKPFLILIAVALIGLIAGAVIFLRPTESAAVAFGRITPAVYQEQFADGTAHLLLDVRTPEEFAGGHIPGAVNIAVQELAQRLDELPGDQPIVIYCRSGNRSAQAAQILAGAGYTKVYDLGGIIDWSAQGYPVQ